MCYDGGMREWRSWAYALVGLIGLVGIVTGSEEEVYHARDFRKACEYLLEQAVNGREHIRMHIDEKEFGRENREKLFYLLPYYRLAEMEVQVMVDPEAEEAPVDFLLSPKYKSCVKMLNYARGHRDTKLTAKEQQALALARQALSSAVTPDMTHTQKARALHDWVIKNTAYDLPNANFDRKPQGDEYTPFDGKYLFLEHKGVCDAYVQAYWLLLQMAGVPCSTISGYVPEYKQGHAWSLVRLDDHWAHVDTTFDDPVPDVAGKVEYTYFDKTDEEMRERRMWQAEMFPNTAGSGFLSTKPLVMKNLEEYKNWLAAQKQQEDTPHLIEIEELRAQNMAASLKKLQTAAQEIGRTVSVAHDILYPYAFRIRISHTAPGA